MNAKKLLVRIIRRVPILNRNTARIYRLLGVKMSVGARISSDVKIMGDMSFLSMGEHAEINTGCFIVAYQKSINDCNMRRKSLKTLY